MVGKGGLKRKSKAASDIPSSSLADMAFLLLIFFMVTTVFRQEQDRDVVFPEAEATQRLEEPRKDILNLYVERDGIPAELAHTADPDDLVQVDHDFHSLHSEQATYTQDAIALHPWDERTVSHSRPLLGAPRTRTDYHVWDPDTRWVYLLTTPESDGTIPEPGPRSSELPEPPPATDARIGLWTPMTTYEQGERRRLSWLEQPLRVGLNPTYPVRRAGDWLVITPGGPRAPDNVWGIGLLDAARNFSGVATSPGSDGFLTRFRVWRDDELLADTPHAPGAPDGTVLLPTGDEARYLMSFEVANQAPWTELSTQLRTQWSFRSARTDPHDPQPVELMTVDYELGVDLHNRVAAPRDRRGPSTIGVTVGHQDGVDLAVTKVAMDVSYDDGKTWRPVPVKKAGGGEFSATLGGHPGSAEFLSLRIQARDIAGNTVEQEVIRAAGIDS
jgi:biopolymer transport protein ExbD